MPVLKLSNVKKRYWPNLLGMNRYDLLIHNINGLNAKLLNRCSKHFYADIKKIELYLRREIDIINGQNKNIFGKKSLGGLLRQYIDPHLNRINNQVSAGTEILSAAAAIQSSIKFDVFLSDLIHIHYKNHDSVEVLSRTQYEYIYQELDYIRNLILIFNSYINHYSPPTFCHICFRKTLQRRYCHHHKSTSSEFYLSKKKQSAYQEKTEIKELLMFRKKHYEFEGERVHDSSDPVIKLNGDYWAINFSKLLNSMPNVSVHVSSNCKYIGESLAESLHHSFEDFSECIKQLYLSPKFDNRYETDYSPYTVMTTLYLAEAWFETESEFEGDRDGRKKDNAARNTMIINYYKKGYSVRKISSELQISGYKLGKSAVMKVIKSLGVNKGDME